MLHVAQYKNTLFISIWVFSVPLSLCGEKLTKKIIRNQGQTEDSSSWIRPAANGSAWLW